MRAEKVGYPDGLPVRSILYVLIPVALYIFFVRPGQGGLSGIPAPARVRAAACVVRKAHRADLLGTSAARGDVSGLRQLASRGADLNGADREGATVLQNAAAAGKVAAVKFLLSQGVEIDEIGPQGKTALAAAIEHNQLEAARLLLESGADPNVGDGLVPLNFAAFKGNVAACRLLLAHGADARGCGRLSESPLVLAARGNHAEVVKILLKAGAPIETPDPQGNTPLLVALRARAWRAARLLIEKGADLKALDPDVQGTPLHWAAMGRDLPTVKLLIEHGASVSARDNFGRTPADFAKINAMEPSDFEGVEAILAQSSGIAKGSAN